MKKIPMRMCVLTRERYPKRELIRIVSTDGVISIDETGKKNGKGCYLKKDKDRILKAKEKKILNSVFNQEVNEEIYDEILKLI